MLDLHGFHVGQPATRLHLPRSLLIVTQMHLNLVINHSFLQLVVLEPEPLTCLPATACGPLGVLHPTPEQSFSSSPEGSSRTSEGMTGPSWHPPQNTPVETKVRPETQGRSVFQGQWNHVEKGSTSEDLIPSTSMKACYFKPKPLACGSFTQSCLVWCCCYLQ